MTEAQKIVLDLLGQTLFGVPFDQKKYFEINWQAVLAEASKQTVIPATVDAVPEEAPKSVLLQWMRAACENEAGRCRILNNHALIDRIMRGAGIPYVILKGAASGAYYPSMHLRHYGDVDFLIPENLQEKVLSVLDREGFKFESSHPYEIDLTYDHVAFDLHTAVNGIPGGLCGDSANDILKDIIDTAQDYEINGSLIKVPDELHHGIVLLLHTAVHLVGFGAGLRQLCDWAAFADHMGERFPAIFENPLKRTGLWRFAQIMSVACVIYMHMPEYSWCRVGPEEQLLADDLMEEVLRKGDLAHSGDDDMDSVFMREPDRGGTGGSLMLIQALRNTVSKVKYQWPFMNKYKFMIPFGMIFMFARYLKGMADGTYKKSSITGTFLRAKQRKQFYDELELFKAG